MTAIQIEVEGHRITLQHQFWDEHLVNSIARDEKTWNTHKNFAFSTTGNIKDAKEELLRRFDTGAFNSSL